MPGIRAAGRACAAPRGRIRSGEGWVHRGARGYRSVTASEAQALERIAEAAYTGGELGVLELVDAHRGALDAELLALDLEAAARRARVELERLAGGEPR